MQPKSLYDTNWQMELSRQREKYSSDFNERIHELCQHCAMHETMDSIAGASSFFFMLDLIKMKFVYVSKGVKTIIGYPAEEVLKAEFPFYYNTCHPKDAKILVKLHKQLFSFFSSVPVHERTKLKFCYNLRLRRKDGTYMHLLQQTLFLKVSDRGFPLVDFSTFTDITSFKRDHHLTLVIQKLNGTGQYEEVYKEEFSNYDFAFTRRQLEIMTLISTGMTTKEIAAYLCLSMDTVKNHRKNILKMTGSKNVVEVYKGMLSG